MRVDEIEIHAGEADFPYTAIRRLEAKCEAPTNFSKAPSMDDVNQKLRQMAASVGANAVIDVKYETGPTLTSWRSIRGFGLAVSKLSDEMPCPQCAETIKRAAKRCRFCGAEVPESAKAPVAASEPTSANNGDQAALPEPLRSSDNMPVIVMVIIGLLIGLALISQM
jgi:hypothetical protein